MARQREFDEDQVLESAMEAFWQKGYEATSMTDLMAATGLAKGSIYKAFGDKHNLFMQALERYLVMTGQRSREKLADPSASTGIQQWLHEAVVLAEEHEGELCGCLALRTGVELGPHDETVKQRLDAHRDYILGQLTEIIIGAQGQQELRQDIDPLMMAMLLGVFHMGLSAAMGTQTVDREAGEALIDQFVTLLKTAKD